MQAKDTEIISSISEMDVVRFLAMVSKDGPNGCWEWTGPARGGYGVFHVRRTGGGFRCCQSHRIAYWLLTRGLSDDLHLDHQCRNRKCVNPAHLRPMTNRENVLLGIGPTAVNAAKTHCIHGHLLEGDNLKPDPTGRRCRICHRRRNAEYYARRKAGVNP